MGGALLLGWLILAAFAGVFASSRGRSGLGYALAATVLSPLLIFVLVAILPNRAAALEAAAAAAELRPCPHCAEPIRAGARICRYCQREAAGPA